MFRTFLSLRYLRARKTNWIGMAGIFVAVAALVMILSIMGGFLQVMRDTLRGNLADLQITPGELKSIVLDGKEVDAERDVEGLVEIVENHPLVEAATPQLGWYGLLMPDFLERAYERPLADQIKLVQIVGIDPETEVAATEFRESLEREYSKKPGGRIDCTVKRPSNLDDPFALPPDDGRRRRRDERPPDPILVGEQIAYIWGLYKGQTVTLFSATFTDKGKIAETAATRRFQVVGSFRTADNEMDSSRVYLLRGDAADFLQRDAPNDWTSVVVKLKDYDRDKETVREELRSELHQARYLRAPDSRSEPIQTWEDFRRQLLRAIQNEKMLMAIMLSLVLVVACFTIFALLSMMVTEKRRDIGIMAALGANSRGILAVFLLIGLWEAIVGSTLGALAGIYGAIKIDPFERWLSSTFGFQIFDRDIYLFDHIPSDVTPLGVGLIVGGAIFFTLLFAAIPAWRASRLDPVEALRHE
ncbi:MAG: ABC transporter permease [Planctomycetota bacterium]